MKKKNGRPRLSGSVEQILKRKEYESKQMVVVRSLVDRVFANLQSFKKID